MLLQNLQQHSLVLLLACLQLELLPNPLPELAAGQNCNYSMKQMIETLAKPVKGDKQEQHNLSVRTCGPTPSALAT